MLPEHARAVGEQLPRGRDPEGVHRVLLLGDEGGGHHVEVPGRPGLEEGGPAGRPGIEGVHQHITRGIEEGAGIAPHLVVEDAALAPGAEPGDEVGDQHGLARAGGARNDGVLGLGAPGPGDPGDAAGGSARGGEQGLGQARGHGLHAPSQLPGRRHFRAADPLGTVQAPSQDREQDRAQDHAPHSDPEAEPRPGVDGMEHAFPDPFDPGVLGDIHDSQGRFLALSPLVRLEGVTWIPERELDLGEGARSDEAPFMGGRGAEQGHGRDQDDRQGDAQKPPADQLAPHVDVMGQGLAAPERCVAEHDETLLLQNTGVFMSRAGAWIPERGRGRRRSG